MLVPVLMVIPIKCGTSNLKPLEPSICIRVLFFNFFWYKKFGDFFKKEKEKLVEFTLEETPLLKIFQIFLSKKIRSRSYYWAIWIQYIGLVLAHGHWFNFIIFLNSRLNWVSNQLKIKIFKLDLDLTKFGDIWLQVTQRNVEMFRNPAIFWQYHGTCCLNMAIWKEKSS